MKPKSWFYPDNRYGPIGVRRMFLMNNNSYIVGFKPDRFKLFIRKKSCTNFLISQVITFDELKRAYIKE